MVAKKKQLSVFWLALLLMFGALIAGVVYSYSMFHSIVPTRAAIDNVANCRENGSPNDADPFSCLDRFGTWKPVPYNSLPVCAAIAIILAFAAPLLTRSGYLKWAVSSLKGHLTLWPLLFGIPEILLGLHLNFIEGTLTADWAAHLIIYGAIISTVAAVPFWFLITKPFMARRTRRKNA